MKAFLLRSQRKQNVHLFRKLMQYFPRNRKVDHLVSLSSFSSPSFLFRPLISIRTLKAKRLSYFIGCKKWERRRSRLAFEKGEGKEGRGRGRIAKNAAGRGERFDILSCTLGNFFLKKTSKFCKSYLLGKK